MNRQQTILYRARRHPDDEWVYGLPRYDNVDDGIITAFETLDGKIHFIDIDTLGEFTGITDKNDERVFEDDIARIKYEGKLYVGLIQYDALGVFIFVARGFGWVPLFKLADDDLTQRNGRKLTAIEIIGNLHDNHELLEAGK